MSGRTGVTRSAAVWVFAATALALVAGWLLRAPCVGPWHGQQYATGCYSDVQFLYDYRGVHEHVVPYVHGRLEHDRLVNGAIEYPVLTGMFMWLVGLPVQSRDAYLMLTAAVLAAVTFAVSWMLLRVGRMRALLFAACPSLAVYAFYNWDLLAVAATVAGLLAWRRNRPYAAAGWLAVGACLKVFPGFFVVPLVLALWLRRERARAVRTAGIAVATAAAINVPFVIANPSGWWATYRFQALRQADNTTNSLWAWALTPQLDRSQVNRLSALLVIVTFAAVLAVGWWRSRREATYPVVAVGAAMVAGFLLWNKVDSPQYTLWLLPLFVLLPVHPGWWAAFTAADLTLYFGIYRWYDALLHGHDFGLAKQAAVVGVWDRIALLAILVVVFCRARDPVTPGPQESRRPSG